MNDKNMSTTSTPLEVFNLLKNLPQDEQLMFHQLVVKEYLQTYSHLRGVIVMHDTGYGKTTTALAVAEAFRKEGRDVVLLSPKSLHANFEQTIKKLTPDSEVPKGYEFVTMNASNMSEQFVLEKQLDKLNKVELNDKVIVVDEAHNLFNSIVNGAKNATRFYDLVMQAKNVKIVLLSGTIMTNHPFELVPAINLVAGYKLLPEHFPDFMRFFVSGNKMINRNKFKNRVFGLVSYFGDLYKTNNTDGNKASTKNAKTRTTSTSDSDEYPKEYPLKREFVEMSVSQFNAYDTARESERKESSKVFGSVQTQALTKPKLLASSSYRVKSRQISNSVHGRPSPKLDKIYEKIEKHPNSLGVVYSSFVKAGLSVMEKLLLDKGWESENADEHSKRYAKSYAIISGEVPPEERANIISRFNADSNKYGKDISLLLVSSTGAEGIDLKNVRHIHIMEPYWNYARIKQIKARANRYRSHHALKPEERDIQPYIYMSVYPSRSKVKISKALREELPTDVDLFDKSVQNQKLIDQFKHALIEASFDCYVHAGQSNSASGVRCLMCLPTGKDLFKKDIYKDMKYLDPCQEYQEQSVQAEEILVEDKKYYFTRTQPMRIFRYLPHMDSYVEILSSSDEYHVVKDNIENVRA